MRAPAVPQGLESRPPILRAEGNLKDIAKLPIEVAGSTLRVLDVAHDDIGQLGESVGKQANGGALASPRIPRNHDEAAVRDADLHTSDERVDAGRGVQCLNGHVRPEWIEFQSVHSLHLRVHLRLLFVAVVCFDGLVLGQIGGWQAGGGVVAHQLAQSRREARLRLLGVRLSGQADGATTPVGVLLLVERQKRGQVTASTWIDEVDAR